MVSGIDTERGQLLLAGSVAIAVTLVGMAVILNAAVFSDARTETGHATALTRAAGTQAEVIEADLERLGRNVSDPEELRRILTTYEDRRSALAARSRAVSIDLALVDGSGSTYTVELRYDTPDLAFTRTLTITGGSA